MAKRVDTTGIDAEFVINQAKPGNREKDLKPYDPSASASTPEPETVEETPQEEIIPPAAEPETVKGKEIPREENKRKRKAQPEDYEALFIRTAPTTTRSGKAVYIRKEFHDRIMRIVQNIGYNEVSLFSYIDNVLEHHFNTYQDDITELYRKRRPEDIF
ncbi:conserved hypothetical protein [uncultured Dysgonomonas sp.]|uniref:DUF3408 domain-containing protein n=1 Tax=uncultured Dysgonomonas sp. TaxID=206096 RepID=A0A212IV27_9BACT|nr:DUF3408 domain-containing protein [Bacteroides thetaiotaomicron]MDC2215941.1 DUF3408 domain-containing protein [Bacteroides thetaiotaomicron]SBV91056.1 conserved hypothetical protein [uncultured Dysgonomonas sp.]